MQKAELIARRRSELRRQLDGVNDPELDEPITEMGFVERADVLEDGRVEIDFRLPTYWCSPNFAYLMLDDMARAVEALSWSPEARIVLHDHMFAEDVNRGVSEGKSFAEIFAALSDTSTLDELRLKFRHKAFLRRQEAVILALREAGYGNADIVGMTVAAFDAAQMKGPQDAHVKRRYREALLARWNDLNTHDPVIVEWDGSPIAAADLADHLGKLRNVRINMEFNGALCRGLKTTRYKEVDVVDGEPTLVDFILDRVPVRGDCAGAARN